MAQPIDPIPAPGAANGVAGLLATARQLLEQGRFSEADRASGSVLAREPSNPQAILIHVAASIRLGALDEAERAVESLLRIAPGQPATLFVKAEVLHAQSRDAAALAVAASALAAVFAVADEPLLAARGMLDVVASQPFERWVRHQPALRLFGALLASTQAHEPAARALIDYAAALPFAADNLRVRRAAVAALLGFSRGAPREWNRAFFERLLLPWMREALEGGRFDEAFELEDAAYESYVKQTESEAHFEESVARWKDMMREAGARFATSLPPAARRAPGPLPRIAFFVHNVTELAHVQMVLGLLEGHARLAAPRFEPYVFCIAGQREALERFRKIGVRVEVLAGQGSQAAALAALKRRIDEEGIDEIVWVSVVLLMPFALAMRLAPAQTWWAMKYHSLELPEIDGYLTGGGVEGGTKTIAGRAWLAGPVAGGEWTAPQRADDAAAIRRSLGSPDMIYGTFGREEKLDSPEFLDAVARILHAVPGALFLWTGRTPLASIQKHFEAAGVAERCRFIGWVDTKLYAQVIDVFLDSFPFPCGFTLYEAMAAGKPGVLFASAASADTGANALIAPLLDQGDPQRESARMARSIFMPEGEMLCLRAKSADEYVTLATRAGTDRVLREKSGHAYREFVERFLADRERAAAIYADHFATILAAARNRTGGS